ncbi:unnamed protein product [Paramecium sonneborni]|uniref:Uncharacterized protein n=1 Tax=Paramecium sonneborni TaxID=65129 RepID=A0A8S1PF61_9CILI|nr:unnamed protein product [Paramecium sonneborni]
MNSNNKIDQRYQQITNWEEQNFEKEFYTFNKQGYNYEKKIIQIKITSDQKIIYSQNGANLRLVECHNNLEQPEMFNNFDQICKLSWQGQQDINKKKDGKWIAFWNGKNLINVGGYYKEGQKHGLWKDLFLNYSSQAKIFETGEYYYDLRIGKWNYMDNDMMIGGGFYNQFGQKQGKWIELGEGFYANGIVNQFGEYNMNGMKVGRWDIMYCGWYRGKKDKYMQILFVYKNIQYMYSGGGSYDQEGRKIGKWVELFEGFNDIAQVTYNGEYNMNGMKVGRWDIMYCESDWEGYEQMQIQVIQKNIKYMYSGGGSYDQEGNQQKIGKWVELDKEFYFNGEDSKQVTYNGEYNMNGMKVGRWDIMYCDRYRWKKYEQIGGGSYDQEGKKIGKWVELAERFCCAKYSESQVVYNGEYNSNGMKVGRWDMMNLQHIHPLIGCINFDENGNEIYRSQNVTINFIGSFKNCRKVGRWDYIYRSYGATEYKTIGGGSYDEEGNQNKIGKWVELGERFSCHNEVTYNGEYNMKGQKVGIWVEMNIKENIKRGEKIYNY